MSEGYLRNLQSEEIVDLEINGCTADNSPLLFMPSTFATSIFRGVWHWAFLKRSLLFREE